jgi:chromosome segregation ATPase
MEGDMRSNHVCLLACSALIVLGLRVPAIAGPEDDLAQLNALRQQLDGIKPEVARYAGEAKDALDDARPALKEHKVYLGEKPQLDAKATEINNRVNTLAAETTKHEQAVARHKAGCPDRIKDAGQLARCNGEVNPLNNWRDRLITEKKSIQEAYRPLQSVYERDAVLVARIKADAQKYEEAAQHAREAQARAEQLVKRIMDAVLVCQKFRGGINPPPEGQGRTRYLEAATYCQSRNFDGAPPNLPPLVVPSPDF